MMMVMVVVLLVVVVVTSDLMLYYCRTVLPSRSDVSGQQANVTTTFLAMEMNILNLYLETSGM